MSEEFRYFYVDKKTRCKTEVNASSIILECESGEVFRLYGDSDGSVFVRCNEQLVVKPKSSNQIELEER